MREGQVVTLYMDAIQAEVCGPPGMLDELIWLRLPNGALLALSRAALPDYADFGNDDDDEEDDNDG